MTADGHSVRLIAGRGEAMNETIPLASIPFADSRHERVMKMKKELDRGEVTERFTSLRDELAVQLRQALDGVDILIAHNVCSLNKNLALTAALYQLHQAGELPRLILWHHDLAWTTPRYRYELYDGDPWNLLRTDWGQTTHVAVSEARRMELAKLMNIDPASVHVIPNGVDIARFYKLEPQTQALIGKLGILDAAPIFLLPVRVTPRKNIELALHTLVELRRYFPQARLVITGPLGPHSASNHKYFKTLLELRTLLNLQNAVHFLAEMTDSFLSDQVIADFYRIADALFLPSREEGFGIPILEAGLAGLPVFCSDIPPLRSLGEDHVTYFPPDADPHELASIMAKRLSSDSVYGLRAGVRRQYTWERIYSEKISPLLG